MTQSPLPDAIQQRFENILTSIDTDASVTQRRQAFHNMLSIIASLVSVTSASLLQYESETYQSTVISEYDSNRVGYLERDSSMGEIYDEREFKVVFKWLETTPTKPELLHINKLPQNSKERRELQSYAVQSSLLLPIITPNNTFWGYVELWESRYERIFQQDDLEQLMAATHYLGRLTAK